MRSGDRGALWLVLLLAALCLPIPSAAGTLVLRASSEAVAKRYRPGTILTSRPIMLGAGEWLQVVTDGKIVRLNGPTQIHPAPVRPRERSMFERIVAALRGVDGRRANDRPTRSVPGSRFNDRRVEFGVSTVARQDIGGGEIPTGLSEISPTRWPGDLAMVDVSRGGTICYRERAQARLWRSDPAPRLRVEFEQRATGTRSAFVWPEGAQTVPWPAGMALAEGEYELRAISVPVIVELKLRAVKDAPDGAMLLATLAGHDCLRQFDQLVDESGTYGAAR